MMRKLVLKLLFEIPTRMRIAMRNSPLVLALTSAIVFSHSTYTTADDAVINTPTVLANLKGEWELQPKVKDGYRQRLSLNGSACGDWQQSQRTLPVSITFYVEGNELLIQHYYEPKGAFNYRLKQLRYDYKLDGDTLTLKRDGVTETWKRGKRPEAKSN